jgi:hypothetical protein
LSDNGTLPPWMVVLIGGLAAALEDAEAVHRMRYQVDKPVELILQASRPLGPEADAAIFTDVLNTGHAEISAARLPRKTYQAVGR